MKVQTCEIGSPISENLRTTMPLIPACFVCPVEIFVYLERAKSGNAGAIAAWLTQFN